MLNSILQEAGSAHVDDFNDPDLALVLAFQCENDGRSC